MLSTSQLRGLCPLVMCTVLGFAAAAAPSQDETKDKVAAAKKVLEAAVQEAVDEYISALDAAIAEAKDSGDRDYALSLESERKLLKLHGLSTLPDPSAKSKRILLNNIFRKTDGAILDFRPDYTAYGRHNGLTTNWVMTDPQTLIVGATSPSKPLYIYKFDKSLSRGTVYKYQPLTKERKHTVRRTPR